MAITKKQVKHRYVHAGSNNLVMYDKKNDFYLIYVKDNFKEGILKDKNYMSEFTELQWQGIVERCHMDETKYKKEKVYD